MSCNSYTKLRQLDFDAVAAHGNKTHIAAPFIMNNLHNTQKVKGLLLIHFRCYVMVLQWNNTQLEQLDQKWSGGVLVDKPIFSEVWNSLHWHSGRVLMTWSRNSKLERIWKALAVLCPWAKHFYPHCWPRKQTYNIALYWFTCLILFALILYVASTIFQLNRDGSYWVEPY